MIVGDPYGNRTRDTAVKGRCLNRLTNGPIKMERVMGIEPTTSAWKAEVLPLNYTRKNGGGRGIRTPAGDEAPVGFQDRSLQPDLGIPPKYLVEPSGIEPLTSCVQGRRSPS